MNTVTRSPAESPAPNGGNIARLRELSILFLKVGAISFGGPAAHVALIEAEVVRKRQWLTQQQFLDMLGAANLIPGPTSTEIAINVGFVRAGWAGLCVAGASFILPAALITGIFAWAYVRFGGLPQAASVLAGIKSAVIAVIGIAIWRLGKTAVRDVGLAVLGGLALAAFFLGANPIAILLGGGADRNAGAAGCKHTCCWCHARLGCGPFPRSDARLVESLADGIVSLNDCSGRRISRGGNSCRQSHRSPGSVCFSSKWEQSSMAVDTCSWRFSSRDLSSSMHG